MMIPAVQVLVVIKKLMIDCRVSCCIEATIDSASSIISEMQNGGTGCHSRSTHKPIVLVMKCI